MTTIETKIATNNSKVDTANKTARLAELKAEYDNLTDALLNDENISDERDANLRHLRADVRSEISKLEVAIEAENNTKAAMTIEMKIAKNGSLICKRNGKRESLSKLNEEYAYGAGRVADIEAFILNGHKFTNRGYGSAVNKHPLGRAMY
ncbi:MAG: hypothetical protein IKN27_08555, partial [Selenomonadaceae bacterium]|nr:hypothetical protein [Selenomonadaceae bacterium]